VDHWQDPTVQNFQNLRLVTYRLFYWTNKFKGTVIARVCHKTMNIFRNTHRRKPEGRYSVQLPFKDYKTPDIGLSRDTAVKRFHALEAKFKQNPQFKREYEEVINDYLILNHAEKVTTEENFEKDSNFYLPHHAVIKTESMTTKTRVVFDASARSSNGTSLNDHPTKIATRFVFDLNSV
jgi:hypothetical protein